MVATYVPGPHGPMVFSSTAGGGGGATAKSLVLAKASNQYLSRTWGSAPTDGTKTTIAFWFKWVSITGTNYLYTTSAVSSTLLDLGFAASPLIFSIADDVSGNYNIASGGITSDTTTWHHLCIRLDSNQATSTNRGRIYVDGVEVSYNTQTEPSSGANWQATSNGVVSYIGQVSYNLSTNSPDIKLAYFYLIDGQALAPSSFTTGTGASIHPTAYGGTFGTNGFFMDFSSSNTNDQSGNANNWTQVNSPTFASDIPT